MGVGWGGGVFLFFKQKKADEMRISDWSSDVCSSDLEQGGWFNNWYKATARAQKKYGVPKAIILATIRQESSFRANAKPPRRRLLGFIPWTRPSNAFGFPQALDSTWDSYCKSTGNYGAERDDFSDAADFVGWYYRQSHKRNGIALNDAYHLYMTYYLGHGDRKSTRLNSSH